MYIYIHLGQPNARAPAAPKGPGTPARFLASRAIYEGRGMVMTRSRLEWAIRPARTLGHSATQSSRAVQGTPREWPTDAAVHESLERWVIPLCALHLLAPEG